MRVFNKDKTQELKDYDLTKGYLLDDEITIEHEAEIVHHEAEIIHHEAVEGVKEQGHYEVVTEYPNGGADLDWVVDVAEVAPREAYDEVIKEAYDEVVRGARTDTECIKVYIPRTEKELKEIALRKEGDELMSWLFGHDYIGIKIATGRATAEEYATEIAEMTAKANRLNEIDKELEALGSQKDELTK